MYCLLENCQDAGPAFLLAASLPESCQVIVKGLANQTGTNWHGKAVSGCDMPPTAVGGKTIVNGVNFSMEWVRFICVASCDSDGSIWSGSCTTTTTTVGPMEVSNAATDATPCIMMLLGFFVLQHLFV
jgi:hypothetical protein